MLTDPIADTLTRIRNGLHARHDQVDIPFSNLRHAICKVLVNEGFLETAEVNGEGYKRRLLLRLRYSRERQPVIEGLKRVSRPGMRRYVGANDLPRIRGGMGISVISTPQGMMTDRQARKNNVGGEVLFQVW
jgi:small subunit ribosomal protein S8